MNEETILDKFQHIVRKKQEKNIRTWEFVHIYFFAYAFFNVWTSNTTNIVIVSCIIVVEDVFVTHVCYQPNEDGKDNERM
jgi:hypothetical protein